MLKGLLTFLLLFTLNSFTYGQKISFGLRTGLNLSNQTQNYHQFTHPTFGLTGEDKRYTNNSKIGIKLGAFAHIGLTRFLSLVPGLLYNGKGMEIDMRYYDPDTSPYFFTKSYRVSLHYLSFDAPLKVKLTKGDWAPYLLIGARIDALLGYKQAIDKKYFAFQGPGYEGYKEAYDQLNKVNVGLLTAMGIERKLNERINLFLEVEYNVARAAHEPWITITNSMFALNGGIRWKKN